MRHALQDRQFASDSGSFLGEIVGRLEIAAEKPNFAVYVTFEQRRASGVHKPAVNCDRSFASDGGDLTLPLTALLEPSHIAVKNYVLMSVHVAISVAIDVLKATHLLNLLN